MLEFVGREQELADLNRMLDQVRAAIGGRAPGQCVQMRGRRRIGKSSLVEEFLLRAEVPSIFFTAERRPGDEELESLWQSVVESSWEGADFAAGVVPKSWSSALSTLATALPDDRPTVLVLDEVPYLIEQVPAFEGILQRAWDRELSRKPVLLILIGSDLAMMEALNAYDRPFHQRGREMAIGPLSPAAIADMLDLDPAEAFDAALVTGGLPLICAEWGRARSLSEFLADSVANPLSALMVSAERTLVAEFPVEAQSYQVLTAIGSGERTFTNISRQAGDPAGSSLTRALGILTRKRIVVAESPLALRPSKNKRYRITDPYLRFWLSFIAPNRALIERRRADLALEKINAGWTAWRGRVVEPLLRESLARILPAKGIPAAAAVGSLWTRKNDVEIDVVGADREPDARELYFLGSIKWLEKASFDAHDLVALQRHRAAISDSPLPLLALTRCGTRCKGLDASFDAEDLLAAWRP
ncbi:MAG: ATP-binding protein [Actinophytocola sp.]|nr:ATP-binding protein [Actinophytocola sp.]